MSVTHRRRRHDRYNLVVTGVRYAETTSVKTVRRTVVMCRDDRKPPLGSLGDVTPHEVGQTLTGL